MMESTADPALDLTIDARGPATLDEPSRATEASAAFCCRGGKIANSKAGLSGYTHTLLLMRLRAAAAILLGAFSLFLIWALLAPDDFAAAKDLMGLHVGTIVILAITLAALFKYPWMSKSLLRTAEILIFAAPALFFLMMDSSVLVESVRKSGDSRSISSGWLILMMIYALMVPNTWRRASVVLGLYVAAPVGLLIFLRSTNAELTEALSLAKVSIDGLVLLVGSVTATYGVHVINSLRTRVFEANQIGVYKLKRLLGRGGMGEVHLAEHQLLKRRAAIKLISPENAGDPKALIRFEREVQTAATLSHPNTIEIYDYGSTDDGTFYYVMEHLRGLNLAELIKQHGALPEQRVLHFLRQAAGALSEAHRAGLIHRDLKPANIFAAERGGIYDFVKLLDFGLVKDNRASTEGSTDNDLTQEGSITGSPHYMSPEQSVGGTADARSDLYSLGAVGYFLLTARPPFEGESPMAVLVAHARDAVTPVSDLRDDVSTNLTAIINRCLEKRPEDRFASAEELAEALQDCVVPGEWDAAAAAAWWQGNRETELAQVS